MSKAYKYGMRLRPYDIGCQPRGVIGFNNYVEGYHSLIFYKRELTDKEISEYSLDYLGEVTK